MDQLVGMCLLCNGGGAAWGKAPEVRIVTLPDGIIVSVGQAVPFEASIATDDTERSAPKVQWLWDFGDKATSDKNPTTHAYGEAGLYKVTVTATTDDGTATASVEVIVTSGEDGGGGKQVVNCIYIRDVTPPRPTIPNDQACDCIHVVFETTNPVMGMPALSKQSVPGGDWTSMGTATEEQTGIPGKRRWWWAWPTWPEKNADVSFKVVYTKPMPPTQITVGPVAFTVDNTVVSGTQELLLWDGTNAVTVPWAITHSPYGSPVFDVTVAIYPVGSSSPVKTFLLEDQPLSEDPSSLEWEGETDPDPPGEAAPPGVYTYTVTAEHVGEGPGCTDTDKVTSVLEFGGNVAHDLFVPTLSLHTEASLRANQDAGYAWVELFHSGTPRLLSGADLGPLAGNPTVWWPIEFTDAIEHDDVGQYEFVATGTQGAEAAQSNRSLAPKWLKPIATAFHEWPRGHCVAGRGTGGAVEPVLEAQANTAAADLAQYQSPEGYLYSSTVGAPVAAALHTALAETSIVYVASHARPNHAALVVGGNPPQHKLRGGTDGEDPPGNDAPNDIYYIEELLFSGAMEHCRFIFFAGCNTADHSAAGESLLEAAVQQGADLAAGFRDYEYLGARALLFSERFWHHALNDHMSVATAARAAIDDVEAQYGEGNTGGTNTFYLYPLGADEDLWRVEWGE